MLNDPAADSAKERSTPAEGGVVDSIGPAGERGGGLIFIISAPSGTGKTTLLGKMIEQLPGLRFSVSHTTRPRRANEQEGKDYHFVSLPVFQQMVERDEFLEWAEVMGHRYGTARMNVEGLASEGIDLILDIDTQGAKKVKEKVSRAVSVFLLPPSPRVLEERLVKRGLDSPEVIRLRLSCAQREIEEAHRYDYVVVNDRMEKAEEQLKAIIVAERCRQRKDSLIREKKKQWEEHHGKNHR